MASLNFPTLRIGDPIQEGSFQVFPLFSQGEQEVAYRLPDLQTQEATITEVSEAGAVPHLVVENPVSSYCCWEYRAESQRGDQGSALFHDGKVVYLSAVSRQ
ncbi:ARPP-1 family domain-containing protein [Thermostichus sp. MS-CIW-28]